MWSVINSNLLLLTFCVVVVLVSICDSNFPGLDGLLSDFCLQWGATSTVEISKTLRHNPFFSDRIVEGGHIKECRAEFLNRTNIESGAWVVGAEFLALIPGQSPQFAVLG